MTVLIIADDAEFARDVVGRWQTERSVPGFTVVSSSVWQGSDGGFELALLGPLSPVQLQSVLRLLASSGATPVLCVANDTAAAQLVHDEFPRVMVLRRYEGWLDATVLLGVEILRRTEANARARQAEQVAAFCQRQAALGRYMLEMRHNANNALTSLLGNAELLLLEHGAFSPGIREQIATIHGMAMRLHEILQRFSSLDAELHFAEQGSHSETKARAQASSTSA